MIDSIFKMIEGSSKPAPRRLDKVGEYALALESYEAKVNYAHANVLIATFRVVWSDAIEPGVGVQHSWFIGSSGWTAEYEVTRAKEFLEAISENVRDEHGNPTPIDQLGPELLAGMHAGALVTATVTTPVDLNGKSKLTTRGRSLFVTKWGSTLTEESLDRAIGVAERWAFECANKSDDDKATKWMKIAQNYMKVMRS